MIKSIFFRALTLLGLTFVLIGCGAADPGEGGTGTPGTGPVTQADLEKIEGSIKDMIQNAKGSINTSNGHAVAMKIISILKASQPNGSCSFFGVDGLAGTADGDNTIVTTKSVTKYLPYTGGAGEGKGGSFEIKVTKDGKEVKGAASAGKLVANAQIAYTYNKFSIDGKYFLDGSIVFKQKGEASDTDGSKLEISDKSKNKFTLSEGAVPIAAIEFGEAIEFTFTGAKCPVIVAVGAAAAAGYDEVFVKDKLPISINPVGDAKFTKVEMGVTAAASASASVTGKNMELLQILVGPKNWLKKGYAS